MKKSILYCALITICGLNSCSSAPTKRNLVVNYEVSKDGNGKRTANVKPSPNFNGTELNIPSTISFNGEDYIVNGIKADAFKDNKFIEKVTIPDTVSWIGWDAFRNCKNLNYVNLGSGVNSLGDHVFSSSYKLSVIEGGENVKKLYKGVFESTSIKNIRFPSLETMDIDCFWNNSKLTEAYFGDKLALIPGSAFERCTSLKTISFSSSLETIDNYAFKGCNSLENIDLSSINTIGIAAFENTNLKSVRLDDVKVYHSAFYNCRNLESAYVNGKEIPYKLFGDCLKLTKIELENVEIIGSNAFKNDPLEQVNIPSTVKSINSEAFANTKLKSLSFENGSSLQSIHRRAFYNNPLSGELILPRSVNRIYTQAFYNTNLDKLSIGDNTLIDDNIANQDCSISRY